MPSDIELEDLSDKRVLESTPETPKHGRINLDANQEQTIAYWAYGATVLYILRSDNLTCISHTHSLLACSIPMMFFPSFLLYLAEPSNERRIALTPLEGFLCTNSGILLAAFAAALLFNVSR